MSKLLSSLNDKKNIIFFNFLDINFAPQLWKITTNFIRNFENVKTMDIMKCRVNSLILKNQVHTFIQTKHYLSQGFYTGQH